MRTYKSFDSPIEYKETDADFEVIQKRRMVSGYFSVFDTVDSDLDIIRKGAYERSINDRGVLSSSNRKIKYLHQHNIYEHAGKLTELKEDDYGLYFEGILEKTPIGDIILERYMNETYREHSIGFKYVKDYCEWVMIGEGEREKEVFECKELNLFEGSVVTFGSNFNTFFAGFKGDFVGLEEEIKNEFKHLIKYAPNYEYEYKLRQHYKKMFDAMKAYKETQTIKYKKPQDSTSDQKPQGPEATGKYF
jgi:HK97 family phage prohead protease